MKHLINILLFVFLLVVIGVGGNFTYSEYQRLQNEKSRKVEYEQKMQDLDREIKELDSLPKDTNQGQRRVF